MHKSHILIVDDDASIVRTLTRLFRDAGFKVSCAGDGEQALSLAHTEVLDLVLLGIWLPGMDGIKTLQALKEQYAEIEVIIMSGHGNIEMAVKVMKLGAFDYIEKPLSLDNLMATVHQALRQRQQGSVHVPPRSERYQPPVLVGDSSQINTLRSHLEQTLRYDTPVLLQGEEGSGKALVARLLHYGSERREGPFVRCKCANLTKRNAERILFGSIGISDDWRTTPTKGYLELANGGTLFLDEVENLSFEGHRKILQAIETCTITRIGGKIPIPLNIRIVASCTLHMNGSQRRRAIFSALDNCLRQHCITIPPLREHKDDIPALAQHFLRMYSGASLKEIDDRVLEAFLHYHWPQNIKELRDILVRMINTTSKDRLDLSDIPPAIRNSSIPIQCSDLVEYPSYNATRYGWKDRLSQYHPHRNTRDIGDAPQNWQIFEKNLEQRFMVQGFSPSSTRQLYQSAQRTLRRSVVLYGQGLHSGLKTGMILSSLPPNSGIVFSNITSGQTIPASIEFVESTDFCTSLQKGGMAARTIEHIMSVLHAYCISNLLIKISDEIPIMDGSAANFCQLIEEGGIEEQNAAVEAFVVDQCYHVGEIRPDAKYIFVEPYNGFRISYRLSYPKPLGIQEITYEHRDSPDYRQNIAPARTFAFLRDVEKMHALGLVAGGRFNNVILIDDEKIVNNIQLRFPDEFARHKVLDIIGDFYLLGRPLRGHIRANMTGHTENIALVQKLHAIMKTT
jgi:UDP-3-O-acyl N-acetylglucosamine deacetylase